VWSGVRGAV